MDKIIIQGGKKLDGKMTMYGAKNSVLPLLACSILPNGTTTLMNCPEISDVKNMLLILNELGVKTSFKNREITVNADSVSCHEIPFSLSERLRSSIFLLGPILGKFRKAKIAYPGGCDIGLRPINLHLSGLKALGAKVVEENGYIICKGDNLHGATIHLDMPSVGATENILMLASQINDTTVIDNASREPEVVDLAKFINKMGGQIRGAGSNTIIIQGGQKLKAIDYKPIPDRIVTGTYLMAAAVSGGKIELNGVISKHIFSELTKLRKSTCKMNVKGDRIYLEAPSRLKPVGRVSTLPYPGFPTDLQSQLMATMSIADGVSIIRENMFEMRFRHIAELNKMGANITSFGNIAIIDGVPSLCGAKVNAYDLRGGAAMCIAGLVANGTTEIIGAENIDRGYESIENELSTLGAICERKRE